MIKFNVERDKNGRKILKVLEVGNSYEENLLKEFFKRPQKGAEHIARKQTTKWDGKTRFYDRHKQSIKFGLWNEVYKFAKETGVKIDIVNMKEHYNPTFNRESVVKFSNWISDGLTYQKKHEDGSVTTENLRPYDYQLEAFYRAIKYKACALELATSAGKSYLTYLYITYLKLQKRVSKDKKALIIVPKVKLVGEMYEGFAKEYNNGNVPVNVVRIGGKFKYTEEDVKNADVIVGTFQSLKNKEPEWFAPFNVVVCDEVHISRGPTVKKMLLDWCAHAEWRLGLSGTIDIDSKYDTLYKIQENVGGPLMMKLPAKFLIDQGYSPKVKVVRLSLNYPRDKTIVEYEKLKGPNGRRMYTDLKKWGKDMMDLEWNYIRENEKRLEFISDFTKKLHKNVLILFNDVQNQYGYKIYEKIKEWNPDTYYVDGDVDQDARAEFQRILEAKDGVVIVASYPTFSTGLNLKNLFHIIGAESTKSEITIRQSIGRGMRKAAGKNQMIFWDLIDNILPNCYSNKHAEERLRIYIKQEFEVINKEKMLK